MKCDQVKEHIADYLAGSLSRAEGEELDAHLAGCASCQQETAALTETWEMLGLLEQENPSAQMRPRFYEALEAYRQGAAAGTPAPARRGWFQWGWQGWAWSAALLAAGLLAGLFVGERQSSQRDMARLQDEVRHMRELVTLSLLEQQSASERLRGVDYAYHVDQSDTQVLAALLHAVNHDPSVNVRLAAVDALRKFAANPSVAGTMGSSLEKQDSPMVQLALIDFIVDTQDKSAAASLSALEHSPAANKNVKEKAVWGLSQLE